MKAGARRLGFWRTVEQQLLLLLGKLLEGLLEVDFVFLRGELDQLSRYCEAEPGPRAPSSSGFDQSVMTLAGSKS